MPDPLPHRLHSVQSLQHVLEYPLTNGDVWFLLDSRWFRALQLYIQFREQQKDDTLNPGPIDNSPLFDPDSRSSSPPTIKSRLIEELEYVKVPEQAWNVLVNEFGIVNVFHAVRRKVISHTGPSSKYKFVEVYPMILSLCLYGKEDSVTVTKSYSRVTKCSALVSDMREMFNIIGEIDVRLHSNDFLLEDHPDMILPDMCLYSGATVLLEVREENGSWSSDDLVAERSKSTPGVCGLINLGHTCFMNTAIQCLSNVPLLTDYLISDAYVADVNVMNPLGTCGELVNAFADLIKQLWSGDQMSVAPRNFKKIIGEVSSRFSGYEEEDTQELMAFLLDGLHEDLNRVTQKPCIVNPDSCDKRPDEVLAQECWSNYKKRNDSMIVDLFHGMLKSNLKCSSCDYSSTTFDPYCFLSVSMPSQEFRPVCVTMETTMINNLLIPTRGSVSEIRDRVVEVLKENGVVVAHEKIVLAEVYENRFQWIFRNEDSYGKNLNNIYAHELEDGATLVCLYLRSNGKLFGQPFMLNLTSLEYNYLSQAIETKLKQRFRDISGFSISLVNAYSNITFQLLSSNHSFSKANRIYVAVDIDPRFVIHYNEDLMKRKIITCESKTEPGIKITDCINEFLSPEVMSADDGWFCPQCKTHRDAIKQLNIWSLPQVLILHVKRFGFNPLGNDKLDAAFDYPIRGLDLSDYVALLKGDDQKKCLYDLVSVALHYGGLRSGHYTAFGKNSRTRGWHHFLDAKVLSVREEDVVSVDAYVLFYVKRDVV